MEYVEYDVDFGYSLIISSKSISTPAQIAEVRRVMKSNGIHRGILADLLSNETAEIIQLCYYLDSFLLIPNISPLLTCPDGSRFASLLIASAVPFFAFDRPELTQHSLILEIERAGKPLNQERLQRALEHVKKSKLLAKSVRIQRALRNAKERGVRLGNPRIKEAQAKARAKQQAARPSTELLRRMALWRQEGKSFHHIARILNERGVSPPRGKQWYASSVRNQLRHSS